MEIKQIITSSEGTKSASIVTIPNIPIIKEGKPKDDNFGGLYRHQ